jgi:hypothetical protein
MNELVSIIIVNWNGLRWLSDCFGSLVKQDYQNYEIIFVDNASKDESVAWVKKNYPKTKILINKENLGFSDANNVGYRIAKGKYVLFLNNDTRVTTTFLTELIKVVESDPKIGGAQSKILLMDHPDTHDSIGAFFTSTGFLYHYGFGAKDNLKYDKQIDLYTAKGACMMFKKSVLKKVEVDGNILDPAYFAYFEETDMCHRVWLAGYRIVYAYKSVIFHKMGATSSSMNNAFVQYHSFKNRINSYLKNLGSVQLWRTLPIHLLFCEFFSVASFFQGKFKLSYNVQKAIVWNLMRLSATMRHRRYIQTNIRKISDDQLWETVLKKTKLVYYWNLSQGKTNYEENV